ncbi:hypothetical protein Agabi119p4_3427 [Agaricus bisporus var. burnettii]|uniref:Uncharacterized protein n=1 Tax=Agaricus bisporus var. burnettii TaxID=192524 RepID=A0A8H7F733_AGABI|nr:hypothetical protein Agabi119p4_3427 [Agaricus bisporus var. burnettii]
MRVSERKEKRGDQVPVCAVERRKGPRSARTSAENTNEMTQPAWTINKSVDSNTWLAPPSHSLLPPLHLALSRTSLASHGTHAPPPSPSLLLSARYVISHHQPLFSRLQSSRHLPQGQPSPRPVFRANRLCHSVRATFNLLHLRDPLNPTTHHKQL